MATLNISSPYTKQIEFFKSEARYTGYGGARGGGKSWAARVKLSLLALNYEGIQMLLLRRTFPELRTNHIIPLQILLKDIAIYKESTKTFEFPNGSRLVLGYCKSESDVLQYQGQSYDVIFIEEATQFTEFQYTCLTECNRLSGLMKVKFKPRMYFTANPGGVGHTWFKRLFIDRNYKASEKSEDYVFIPAQVYDNKFLMENDPDYVRTLENLPEDRKKAMLYGDWDVFEGQYFSEFDREVHTCEPFIIPEDWKRYFVLDYGLDMLAGYFIAMDTENRAYIYKEIYQSGLIISAAANLIRQRTTENIYQYFAPPDLWNRRQDTGKSVADVFAEHGIYLSKTKNDRVQGWYQLKEWLKVGVNEYGNKAASMVIFRNCTNLIRCLPALQYDDKNPNDVATEPHELTHGPDAIRYFFAGQPQPTATKVKVKKKLPFALQTDDDIYEDDYIDWG